MVQELFPSGETRRRYPEQKKRFGFGKEKVFTVSKNLADAGAFFFGFLGNEILSEVLPAFFSKKFKNFVSN